MAALCPPIKIQQFTDSGEFAVGWKIHTYDTGTVTNKETYTDAAGTTPNTNPVILDARGEATIYLGSGAYKFIVKTAADVTVNTIDPVFSFWAGNGVAVSNSGEITVTANTGIVVDGDGVAVDEATAAEAYDLSDAANVMTTRRMRDVFYAGRVQWSGGVPSLDSASDNASGWGVTDNGTGDVTITHNLSLSDTDNLVIIATAQDFAAIASGLIAMVDTRLTDSFRLNLRLDDGTATDSGAIFFICMRIGA